jgi:hypothetical protein
MGESSERPAGLARLVLYCGEAVEVDGSTVFDPVAEERRSAAVSLGDEIDVAEAELARLAVVVCQALT